MIAGGTYNIVFGNNITQTEGCAIELQRPSSRNVIAGNNIINNYVGVYTLYVGSQTGAEGNIIYNNNFVGNGRDVYNDILWDHSHGMHGIMGNKVTTGADIKGTDLNKDGIGDTHTLLTGLTWTITHYV